DNLLEQLRIAAMERHISMSALIREALEDKLRGSRPKPRSLGIGSSGFSDTARLAGEECPEPRSWR
ncbi:MAG: hypothetical protein Q7O66_04770, partial [Dehalococcoidia bacterium]|nr:hypothetical protein [Dehalococcoidia bacterium]